MSSDERTQDDHDPLHHAHMSTEELHDFIGGVLDDDHHDLQLASPAAIAAAAVRAAEAGRASSNNSQSSKGDQRESTTETTADNANTIPDESKTVARSERKRSRERQRRSDVNGKFSELTDVLRVLEATLTAGDATQSEASPLTRKLSSLPPFTPSNRVDLIARTIHVLNALAGERRESVERTISLKEELKRAKKAGEETAAKLKESMTQPVSAGTNRMLMMVPMLVGGNGAPVPADGQSTMNQTPGMQPFMHPGMTMPGMPFSNPNGNTHGQSSAAMPQMTPWGMMAPHGAPGMMPWGMQGMPGMPGMPTMQMAPAPTMMAPTPAPPPSTTITSAPTSTALATPGESLDTSNNSGGKPAAGAPSGNLAHCA